jgi:hypothetical protein
MGAVVIVIKLLWEVEPIFLKWLKHRLEVDSFLWEQRSRAQQGVGIQVERVKRQFGIRELFHWGNEQVKVAWSGAKGFPPLAAITMSVKNFELDPTLLLKMIETAATPPISVIKTITQSAVGLFRNSPRGSLPNSAEGAANH